MEIFYQWDNFYEMSNPIFYENINLLCAEWAQSELK